MNKPFYLILIFLFFSCQDSRDTKNADTVKIDLKSVSRIPGQSNISSIEYIPLETNDNTLIRRINKLLFHDGKFYLLDTDANTIFIFNRDGSFLRKISRLGRGPGEYVDIRNFDVSKDDNSIWVYDNQSQKIIVYDEDLADFQTVNLKYHFEEFAIKGQEAIYVRNLYSDGEIHERLAELDIQKMEYKSLYNKDDYEDDFDLQRFGGYMFHNSAGKLLLNPRFKNNIVQIHNGELENVYEIIGDFPDQSIIEKYRKDPMEVLSSKQYILSINNIYETAGTMIFRIVKDMSSLGAVIVSKNSGEYFTVEFNNEDKYFGGFTGIYGTAENKYVSYVSPASYRNEYWEQYQKIIEESPLSEENKSVLLDAEPADNPIIVLFDFVDF